MFSFLNLNICICRRWLSVRGPDQLRARCPVSSPVRPLRISVALCFKKSSAVVIGIHHIIIKTLRLQVFFLVFCFVFVNLLFVLNSVLGVFLGTNFYFEYLHAYLVFKAWRETQAIFCKVRVAKTSAPKCTHNKLPGHANMQILCQTRQFVLQRKLYELKKNILEFLNFRKKGVFYYVLFVCFSKVRQPHCTVEGPNLSSRGHIPVKVQKGQHRHCVEGPQSQYQYHPDDISMDANR